MKTLNENWFAFTLIAVIFGLLGFLLGRTTGHHGHRGHHEMMMGKPHMMMKTKGAWFMDENGSMEDLPFETIDVIKDDEGNVTVTIDSVMQGGDARIKVIKKRIEEK